MSSTSSYPNTPTDLAPPQLQSSVTPSLLLPSPVHQFKPVQIVDDYLRSSRGFLPDPVDSYISPSFIEVHKLSRSQAADPKEFFELCLMNLHQPSVLSLDIDCRCIVGDEFTHFIDALSVNSTLLELSIIFQQQRLTEVIASQLVEALKLNSTLTRLSLRRNRVDDAAATQLGDLLRFNSTLLSLDLLQTALSENGITQLSAALCVNTSLIHLNLRWNKMTQVCLLYTSPSPRD